VELKVPDAGVILAAGTVIGERRRRMKMSFACGVDHEPERPMLAHTVRIDLEHGL
jgi:hypothetical protein